jgi:CHAD domain-containing protein
VANSAAEEHRERELKFDVPLDWDVPSLDGVVPDGAVHRSTARLETTYFDTAEQDLLRSGVTLRRRRGDTDEGWQLKVPAGDARTEIRLPLGQGRAMPAELRDATLGLRGGAALKPVATLTTRRAIHQLVGADSEPLAEVVIDDVDAKPSADGATSRQWREVEVELVDGDEEFLARAASWLTDNGADPSSSGSKLARALDVETRKPLDSDTLGGLIGAYLDEQFEALVRGDVALRRGQDAIHPTRVATRRYRSVLRVMKKHFDTERAAALSDELRWFATALGDVRDKHVLRGHLDNELAELPPELVLGPVAARIHRMLAAEEQEAAEQLAKTMRSKRYFALLKEVRAWHAELPLVRDQPAKKAKRHVKKAERKVHRRLDAAPDGHGRDEALHRARKAAKRARYTGELSSPELGSSADSTVDRMKGLQDRLGLRQDRVVAAEFLRRAGVAAAAARENGFTFGLLYERQFARVREDDRGGPYL